MFRIFTCTDNADGLPVKTTVAWFVSAALANAFATLNNDWFFEYRSK
jgi:hypothetical protein